MKTIPLWRHISGGIIFSLGLITLVLSIIEVVLHNTKFLSLDFAFALLVYLFTILVTSAFVFPAKGKVR